mmetsp:Transcript_38943/g.101464  ORF Transcript_38943/g.101464 Transcript_38943/m.101464 type:complete len:300 (+) Transcript_38943:249-1148(+)
MMLSWHVAGSAPRMWQLRAQAGPAPPGARSPFSGGSGGSVGPGAPVGAKTCSSHASSWLQPWHSGHSSSTVSSADSQASHGPELAYSGPLARSATRSLHIPALPSRVHSWLQATSDDTVGTGASVGRVSSGGGVRAFTGGGVGVVVADDVVGGGGEVASAEVASAEVVVAEKVLGGSCGGKETPAGRAWLMLLRRLWLIACGSTLNTGVPAGYEKNRVEARPTAPGAMFATACSSFSGSLGAPICTQSPTWNSPSGAISASALLPAAAGASRLPSAVSAARGSGGGTGSKRTSRNRNIA